MSLLSSIRALFSRPAQRAVMPTQPAVQGPSVAYPPPPAGIPALSPDAVLRTQQELVDRLIRAAAMGAQDSQRHARELLQRYAAFVHLLPASETQYYASAGGLLRLGLDMGYYTLRSTQQAVFSIDSADVRQHAEPRWRMAVLVGALLRGLMDTLPTVVVEHRGRVWQPTQGALSEFLRAQRVEQYLVHWQPPADVVVGAGLMAYVIPHIVSDELMAYLSEDRACVSALLGTLSGGRVDESKNIVVKLVEAMYRRVIERDTRVTPVVVQRPQVGARPELDLLDGMRSLIADGTWCVNVRGGRLWLAGNALYLVERQGLTELRERLTRLGKSNAPSDSRTLVEQLTLARLVHEQPWWTVLPEGVTSPLPALRLASAEALISDDADIPTSAFTVLQGRNVPLAKFRASQPQDPVDAAPAAARETAPELLPSTTDESALDSLQALLSVGANSAPHEEPPTPAAAPMDGEEYQQLLAKLNQKGKISEKLLSIDIPMLEEHVIELDGDYYLPVAVLADADINPQQLVMSLSGINQLAIPAGTNKKIPNLDDADCVGFKGPFAKKLFSIDAD